MITNNKFTKYVRRQSTELFVCGILLMTTSLYLPYTLVKPTPSSDKQTVQVTQEMHPTGGPITTITYKVSVQFPKSMTVSESRIIQVTWSTDQWDAWKPTLGQPNSLSVKRLSDSKVPLRLGLFGANMIIKPQETLTSTYSMRDAVCTWTWVISPQKAGDQQLLLEASELGIMSSAYTIQLNDAEKQVIKNRPLQVIPLSVQVLTDEGVSLHTYYIIKYIVMAFGAIMLYPAISSRVTKIMFPPSTPREPQRRLPPD